MLTRAVAASVRGPGHLVRKLTGFGPVSIRVLFIDVGVILTIDAMRNYPLAGRRAEVAVLLRERCWSVGTEDDPWVSREVEDDGDCCKIR